MADSSPTHGWTRDGAPVHAKTMDHLGKGKHWYGRINRKLATWITVGVGSMTCAWLFAALAMAGLPDAVNVGGVGLLFWLSSDFLQLTLLSVIIVGQNIQAAASDARASKTFEDTEKVVDLLDVHTAGGIKVVLDRLDEIEAKVDAK